MDKDASQLEPTCFSNASQILFATVTRCCSSVIARNFIFLKFDHPIYENDTSPFGKGGFFR